MQNAALDETQAGIKIARRSISPLFWWWPNLAQDCPDLSLIPLRFQGILSEKSSYRFKFNMSKAKFMTSL